MKDRGLNINNRISLYTEDLSTNDLSLVSLNNLKFGPEEALLLTKYSAN